MNRDLATAARRDADQQSARLARAAGARQIITTVTVATPGGSADGTAYLIGVAWRGGTTAAGYAASYTPAVGHRVVCVFVDNQLIVLCRIVGQP